MSLIQRANGSPPEIARAGGYETALIAQDSGTITLNGGFNTLWWQKSLPDQYGQSLVWVQGHVVVASVSAPLGKLRMNLPFDVSTTLPITQTSQSTNFAQTWQGLNFTTPLVGRFFGYFAVNSTASFKEFAELMEFTTGNDIADNVQGNSNVIISNWYFTDQDTLN